MIHPTDTGAREICDIRAREILDNRLEPTLRVTVETGSTGTNVMDLRLVVVED